MTRIDRPDLATNQPLPAQESGSAAEETQGPGSVAVVSSAALAQAQDGFGTSSAVELPDAVARLGAPRPPDVNFDAERAAGAEAFAASVNIWGNHLATAAANGQSSTPELNIVSGLASSEYMGGDYLLPTGNTLADMIHRMQSESGPLWEYGDEEFVRIQTEHRKQEDLRKEANLRLTRPDRVLKFLPGGVHNVPNPTERNASYELIDASQRVAELIRANLGLQLLPPPVTG